MTKEKFLIIICIIVVVSAVALRIFTKEDNWICQNGGWVRHGNPSSIQPTSTCPGAIVNTPATSTDEQIIGGNLDEHGCLGPAGYSWCEAKNKCLRVWEELCNLPTATSTEVVITSPQPNELITSPLFVKGFARGNWFFEANLPIKLLDANENIILAHFGTAQSEWMTSDFVPFNGELAFITTSTTGFLLISKDNPSGLPENDASVMIPVRFQ